MPGRRGARPLQSDMEDEEKWILPDKKPNSAHVRLFLAVCLGVATPHRRVWGCLLEQESVCSIGLRLISVVEKVRMIRWMRDLKSILRDNV